MHLDISNITRLGRLPSTGEIIVKRGQVPYENGVPWKLPKSATALDSIAESILKHEAYPP